jgi:hypothetical protein
MFKRLHATLGNYIVLDDHNDHNDRYECPHLDSYRWRRPVTAPECGHGHLDCNCCYRAADDKYRAADDCADDDHHRAEFA